MQLQTAHNLCLSAAANAVAILQNFVRSYAATTAQRQLHITL